MATNAFSGQGLIVSIGTQNGATTAPASDTFIPIGEISDIDLPGLNLSLIEVTHLASAAVERIAGLLDGGTLTLNGNKVPNDPGQLQCYAALDARQMRNFRVTFPTSLTPNQFDAKGFVQNMPVKTAVNDKTALTVSVQLSGKPTWS